MSRVVGHQQGVLDFVLQGHPLDKEGLAHLGKVEVAIEGRGDPEGEGFDAAVA